MGKLILGIIGHRDLRPDDQDEVTRSMSRWVEMHLARHDFQDRSVTLLTSLASGADQLATEQLSAELSTKLAFRSKVSRWLTQHLPTRYFARWLKAKLNIRVVFPYEAAAYRKISLEEHVPPDNGKEAAPKAWLVQVLDEALKENPMVCDPDWKPPCKGKSNDESRKREKEAYQTAAHYIAEKADILIALWDGVYVGKVGGTSDTLHYALSPECQDARRKHKPDPLEVYWLAIPRARNPYPANEAFTWEKLCVPRSSHHSRFRTVLGGRANLWFALTVTVGIASVLCSWLGSLPPRAKFGTSMDMLLIAISHLVLGGLDRAAEGANVLRIGRGLAVVFFGMAVGAVANSLFHLWDRFVLWWTASKDHCLICGLGWRGRQLLADAAENRDGKIGRTIVVERTVTEETQDLCSFTNACLVAGDFTTPETMRQVGVLKVQTAFVVGGEDETNMHMVQQLERHRQATSSKGTSRDMTCCVALNSQQDFQVLRKALPDDSNIDLRIFNSESVTARMFLKLHHLDRFRASPQAEGAEVILVGESAMAHALLREVLQQGVFESGKDLKVAWLRANPERACRDFTLQHPVFEASKIKDSWVARPENPWETEKILPSIRFLGLPPSDRGLLELCEKEDLAANPNWVTSVIVALGEPAGSASIANLLAAYLEQVRKSKKKDITLACYYNTSEDSYRHDIERGLNHDFTSLPIWVFSDFMGNCSMKVVSGDEMDEVARRFNGIYSIGYETNIESEKPFAEYCKRIWRKLSENDKDSNRQRAAHEFVKARIRARKARIGTPLENTNSTDDESAIEHRRWCAEYLLRGFRPLTTIPSGCNDRAADPEDRSCWRLLELVGLIFKVRLTRDMRILRFEKNEEETRQIEQWFSGKKDEFKNCKKHVDLMPLCDFDQVLGKNRSAKEKIKDFTIAANLDKLLHDKITCEEARMLVEEAKQNVQNLSIASS